ncbi:MAG: exonuclease domain-containing protein [Planctomycetes bacterium]|nr:exonuclease domain-containing protein [Planctomycetota bacterium]
MTESAPRRRELLIVDLEATCWERREHRPERMEIIEIGAVLVDPARPGDRLELQTFVRPAACPVLSEFCKALTSIRQEDVDRAPPFPDALEGLLAWLGGDPSSVRLASWGYYDVRQLLQDCARHGLEYPFRDDHFNVKTFAAEGLSTRPMGLAKSLRRCGLELQGTHHRGLDDARNIWRVLEHVTGGDLSGIVGPGSPSP